MKVRYHVSGRAARPRCSLRREHVSASRSTSLVRTSILDAADRPGKAQLTAQGDPRTIFKRAIEKDSLVIAEATARELGRLTVGQALELTALIARKEPHRHERVAAQWLRLYVAEREAVTLNEVAVLVLNLCALATASGHEPALAVLRNAARSQP